MRIKIPGTYIYIYVSHAKRFVAETETQETAQYLQEKSPRQSYLVGLKVHPASLLADEKYQPVFTQLQQLQE